MISDPNLVLYACIAKRTTILAEYTSSSPTTATTDPNLATLASQCLAVTPQLHSTFSHTVCNRTYTFLIDDPDPFVYFSICDENIDRSESFWFLSRLKLALDENIQKSSIAGAEAASSYCLQGDFDSVFAGLLVQKIKIDRFDSVRLLNNDLNENSRDLSLDSSSRNVVVTRGYNAWTKLRNKRRLICNNNIINNSRDGNGDYDDHRDKDNGMIENKVDVIETREFSIQLHKDGDDGGMYYGDKDSSNSSVRHHKINQIWRRHVVVVLMIDFVVCSFLFGGWLAVCKGFECIHE